MAAPQTRPARRRLPEFLDSIEDPKIRSDCRLVSKIMREATEKPATTWGTSIIDFGSNHYKYASGREGSWHIVGFSPPKQNLTLYIMPGLSKFDKLMSQLGQYKTGRSCLYIKSLEDVDRKIPKALIEGSVKHTKRKYSVR